MIDVSNCVVYQIYPKSFKDSNGDGVGDIRGIIEKLDYLATLGVDYLWLTPVFPSPQCDNGYDVADYCAIDPVMGTMADMEDLITTAKQKGMGIMLDMVFNHVSSEHEWFQKALAGDEEYQKYFFFMDGNPDAPPTNWKSKFFGSAWEYVPSLGKWYLHIFDKKQPDLNWENPKVREELKKVIYFWKNKGVEGFRFDVINLISKTGIWEDDLTGDGRKYYTDGPKIHDYLKELTADTGLDEMITVGEMNSTSLDACKKYSDPKEKELSMCFHFHHLKVDYKNGDKWSLQRPDITKLKSIMKEWQEGMQECGSWNAVFWDNHDQPRIVSRMGSEGKYWKESAKMLALCIHLMRGTPYIYQGDEIGMLNPHYRSIEKYRDVESINAYYAMMEKGLTKEETLQALAERSRDNGRNPMQWDASENAGFSINTPWIGCGDTYREINVAKQLEDDDSVFCFYQKLIRCRKETEIIRKGTVEFRENGESIVAYTRTLGEEELLVMCNFSEKIVTIPRLELQQDMTYSVFLDSYSENSKILRDKVQSLRPYEGIALLGKRRR